MDSNDCPDAFVPKRLIPGKYQFLRHVNNPQQIHLSAIHHWQRLDELFDPWYGSL